MRWQEFLKRIHCLLACSNSQIIEENSQVDGKLPENDQGAAIKETTMISKTQLLMLENPSWSKKQETI